MGTAPKCLSVLAILKDGSVCSGSELASRLGVSRAVIWKQVEALRNHGLEIDAVAGQGYRLRQRVELLDPSLLAQGLVANEQLRRLDVVWDIDSTNAELLRRSERESIHGHALLAELQTAGRGRRGRHWIAPLGSGVCLSLGWEFTMQPAAISAMSLAAGVAVVAALKHLGVPELGLKWPNDVVWRGKKLAGILSEIKLESAGRCTTVLGVGVNQRMPTAIAESLDRPVVDLATILANPPDRNQLAQALIEALFVMLSRYERDGFRAYLESWRSLDAMLDREVLLQLPEREVTGLVRDVDDDGALLLEVGGHRERFTVGDLSLRESGR
jgi:BirA family biotin operon repressor/biotin-[acetyl-CoA-carboxylase] ligase